MRFTTSAIAALTIVANSAKLGEGRGKFIDSIGPNKRLESLQTFLNNAKPMWDEMNDPFTDLRASEIGEEHECDLDVGILECGDDEVCVPSPRSQRGGLCQSKMTQEISRQLQVNETSPPTMIDLNGTVSPTYGSNYTAICYGTEYQSYNCSCADFNIVTYNGKISCTNSTWCLDNERALCGTAFYSYYIENSSATSYTSCFEISEERLCYSGNVISGTDDLCLVTMNGCDCNCERAASITCNNSVYEVSTAIVSCPNNVTTDPCNGQGIWSLFGNKVESCDITSAPTSIPVTSSPTLSPTTLAPSKPATGAPVVEETVAPSSRPRTPAPTSSSGMNFNSCFQVAFVVTTMAVFVSYGV
jgi:hypothetical protein